MKTLLIMFLFVSTLCFAEEGIENASIDAAPLMPLSEQLPVTISRENFQKYIENPSVIQQQAGANTRMIQQRAIPWQALFSAFVVIGAIVLVRMMPPPKQRPSEEDPNRMLKLEAMKRIKHLSQLDLKQITDPSLYFTHLDQAVRIYCKGKFKINAPVLTSPELMKEIVASKEIDDKTKSYLFLFLKNGENIKYGQFPLTTEDLSAAIHEASEVIQK